VAGVAGTPAFAMSDRRLAVLALALVAGIAAAVIVETLAGRETPAVNFLDDNGIDASGLV
jgi:hypothetical protein